MKKKLILMTGGLLLLGGFGYDNFNSTTIVETYKIEYMSSRNSKKSLKKYAKGLVLNKYHWSNEDYQALVKIINHESGWNYKAVNKSSKATGLCQALPARKMASEGKDYKTNGQTQMRWCLRYIKQRYKTPSKAWKFWKKHHWF